MKHWLTIPHPGAALFPDIAGWVREQGWEMIEYGIHGTGVHSLGHGELTWIQIRIAAVGGGFWPGARPEITVASGATLVYDDIDRSMAVVLEPEPWDAVSPEPQDAVPSGGHESHCPICRRLWTELPSGHTYTSSGLGCFNVPRADAAPAEPEDAVPDSFVERYADMDLFQDDRPRRSLTDLFFDPRIVRRRK